MPARHSSLRSSLKNQIGLILASWVMSDPLGMFVPLDGRGMQHTQEKRTKF
jgi:hypothetical protein